MVDLNTSAPPEASESEDDDEIKVKREYFTPAQLASQEAQKRVAALSEEYGDKVIFAFDPNDENGIPESFGLMIQPISERTEAGNQLSNIIVCPVPEIGLVQSTDVGKAFIQKAVMAMFATKIANAVRNADGENYSFPKTVQEFLERKARVSDDLSTFETLSKEFVTALRSMGLKRITAKILRNVLQNRAFAEAEYPKIGQDRWETLLDFMFNRAKEEGLSPDIFAKWKANRNTAKSVSEISDIDFEKLDALLGN